MTDALRSFRKAAGEASKAELDRFLDLRPPSAGDIRCLTQHEELTQIIVIAHTASARSVQLTVVAVKAGYRSSPRSASGQAPWPAPLERNHAVQGL